MREEKLIDRIVNNFFVCDKAQLLEIFSEFLGAVEADQASSIGSTMSRNYETAQVNPEINVLPGNLKDARDSIFPYYWGTDDWSSKLHLENVKGPANYASLVGALACFLKNPNLCVDTYSQRSNELEIKAITTLANLVFYHTESPSGVFTMGGTLSNLYGAKIGIEKVVPRAMQNGIQNEKLVGIVSEAAHYSSQTLAGWLGLGADNLRSIPTDRSFGMRVDLLEKALDEAWNAGCKVAFVMATFGSTDAFGIDNVAEIQEVLKCKAEEHGVPKPQLHVDAAVGWAMCFLSEYDLHKNPLGIDEAMLKMVARIRKSTLALQYADSITIDFHKMGWGHYPSSAFMVNKREDLSYLLRTRESMPYFCEAEYGRDPALFTLECSRPGIGPYSVMASLNGIGLRGYQALVLHAIEMAQFAREEIDKLDYCKVLNPKNTGPNVIWWVLPKGRNAESIHRRLMLGELDEEERLGYFTEVKRLFDKRSDAMEIGRDARISFTTSTGHSPHGIPVCAWKAVFFNPKTDRSVVQRLLRSIEEL